LQALSLKADDGSRTRDLRLGKPANEVFYVNHPRRDLSLLPFVGLRLLGRLELVSKGERRL
jgi:hypothetical protein